MSTEAKLRAEFEAWMRDVYFDGIDDAGPWDEARNCYTEFGTHMAWKGYQAATERAAKLERADEKLLDALRDNSWDLRTFDRPTGSGDADIGWRVIEHYMSEPTERTVVEVFEDDPRAAIAAAIRAAGGAKA